MAQTFREFIAEAKTWEYSQEYYNLLKETSEIELMDRYLDNQVFLSENMGLFNDEDSVLTESYFMEYASDDSFEQINESFGEKVKGVFKWIGEKLTMIFKAIGSFFAWIGRSVASLFKGKNVADKVANMSPEEVDEVLKATNGAFITSGGGVGVKQPATKGLEDRNFKMVVQSNRKDIRVPEKIMKASLAAKKQYLIELAQAEDYIICNVDPQGNEKQIDVVGFIEALNTLDSSPDGISDQQIINALKILQKKQSNITKARAALTSQRIDDIISITKKLEKKAKIAQAQDNPDNKTGKNGYASKGKVSSQGVAAISQLYKEVATLMEAYNAQVQRIQAAVAAINKMKKVDVDKEINSRNVAQNAIDDYEKQQADKEAAEKADKKVRSRK